MTYTIISTSLPTLSSIEEKVEETMKIEMPIENISAQAGCTAPQSESRLSMSSDDPCSHVCMLITMGADFC